MQPRQRIADRPAMRNVRPPDPHAVEKCENSGRPIDEAAQRLAAAAADRLRTGEPARCQMFDEIKKKRQITCRDTLLIERENEEACARVQKEVGVLNPFGNSLVGEQSPNIVAGEELLEFLVADIGIDSHRGSLGKGSSTHRAT